MKIVFRADASLQIGTGHVMRCLTLAGALTARGVECHFICREHEGNLIELVRSRGHNVHALSGVIDEQGDRARSRSFLGKIQPAWIIVDHYELDEKWEKAVNSNNAYLMVIDDMTNRPHVCDLLLDQNLGRHATDYKDLVPARARVLAGPRFALVRPEFTAKRKSLEATPKKNWLACVGGLDPKDILGKIVTAWEILSTPKPSLTLAVGANSPNAEALVKRISTLPGTALRHNANMAELMAEADLLIGTTGTISWERCCVGLPSVMGSIAENQRKNCEELARHRTGISVGNWEKITPEKLAAMLDKIRQRPLLLEKMAARARKLVDGRGVDRVAAALLVEQVELRSATPADAERAWQWRNAPDVRKYSHNSAGIPLADHLNWWRAACADRSSALLVAEIGNQALGILRLDHEKEGSTVSLYVDPDLTGLGLGAAILDAGATWCRRERPQTKKLWAEILPENKASQAAFRKAGFASNGQKWVRVL
jgi:UDP-2,4-diacetamido-2,4,6-trideoxy-beta-L-altropyranose hydrolase